MTQIKFKLKLRCPQCGSTRFKAGSAKASPGAPLICAQCGARVDPAAEKKGLEAEVRAALQERLRDRTE